MESPTIMMRGLVTPAGNGEPLLVAPPAPVPPFPPVAPPCWAGAPFEPAHATGAPPRRASIKRPSRISFIISEPEPCQHAKLAPVETPTLAEQVREAEVE